MTQQKAKTGRLVRKPPVETSNDSPRTLGRALSMGQLIWRLFGLVWRYRRQWLGVNAIQLAIFFALAQAGNYHVAELALQGDGVFGRTGGKDRVAAR